MGDVAYLARACVAEGGPFTALALLLAVAVAAAALFWLARQLIRASGRRDDLRRVHDLLLEGSLGEAILHADKRADDPVLGALRGAITTLQSSKSRDQALERLRTEVNISFTRRRMRVFGMLLLMGAALLPAAAGIGGQWWASQQIGAAADAMAAVSPEEVDAVWTDGRASLMYMCPPNVGAPASLALIAALVVLALASLRFWSSRSLAMQLGAECVEMGARVLDPQYSVYAREQGTFVAPANPWDEHVPKGGSI